MRIFSFHGHLLFTPGLRCHYCMLMSNTGMHHKQDLDVFDIFLKRPTQILSLLDAQVRPSLYNCVTTLRDMNQSEAIPRQLRFGGVPELHMLSSQQTTTNDLDPKSLRRLDRAPELAFLSWERTWLDRHLFSSEFSITRRSAWPFTGSKNIPGHPKLDCRS